MFLQRIAVKAAARGKIKQSCIVDGKRRNISIGVINVVSIGSLVVQHYMVSVATDLNSVFIAVSCAEQLRCRLVVISVSVIMQGVISK